MATLCYFIEVLVIIGTTKYRFRVIVGTHHLIEDSVGDRQKPRCYCVDYGHSQILTNNPCFLILPNYLVGLVVDSLEIEKVIFVGLLFLVIEFSLEAKTPGETQKPECLLVEVESVVDEDRVGLLLGVEYQVGKALFLIEADLLNWVVFRIGSSVV